VVTAFSGVAAMTLVLPLCTAALLYPPLRVAASGITLLSSRALCALHNTYLLCCDTSRERQ